MSSVRVVLAGAGGRMGRMLAPALAAAQGLQLVGTLARGDEAAAVLERTRPDVLLDFTLAEASRQLAPLAAARGISPVVGTSGLHEADVAALREACERAGVGGLLVPNFSVGAVLQMKHAEELARVLPLAALRETHHPGKRDKPSGTALATLRRIEAAGGGHIEIESVRREGALAEQEVVFAGEGERVELRHVVTDRRAYLPGVLLALRRVRGLRGLHVGLEAVLAQSLSRPESGASDERPA
jgi:4-hydroxy-tetrahydrodipicolinate reductase